jgi:hypothetical protein
MVKILFLFLLLVSFTFSQEIDRLTPLEEKIKTFISKESYAKNKEFIKLIFSPEIDYYRQDRIDVVKVIETLKENGLLNLFFKKPKELKLSFRTSGSPLFFVKIMGDTLRNIGYYRYVTTKSNLDSSEFVWDISLKSEYATDPLILQRELKKSGCDIIDIDKKSKDKWEYSIDMSKAYLNVVSLQANQKVILKRSLYAHWLNVSNIDKLVIDSSFRDRWHPELSYYDKQLHLLKVIKKDKKTVTISLKIPKYAKYIKISDIYTLKNIRENLTIKPIGSK